MWARLKLIEGASFRRRVIFKTFRLDFVDHDARLVISLEGGEPGRARTGQIVRDRLLSESGYTILRLWRDEAMQDPDRAVMRIKTLLDDLSAHDS